MNIDDIKAHALAEAEAGDFKAVAEKLNAVTDTVINPKAWTIGDLAANPSIGMEAATIVSYTVEKAGVGDTPQAALMRGLFVAINTNGVSLHTADRQATIDTLATAAGWPKELTAAIKSAGVSVTKRFDPEITEDEAKEVWQDWVAAEAAANAAAALAELIANKQAALAESNDACIRVIRETEDVTQAAVLAAFTTRLAETWPVEV